ncbi:MAG: tetratricopeptide repeat protein [Alphaproteobacteria bacterium]|nr:tetratricopeptide repeat protein [Alphaproteobacteria bacterium]
MKAAARSTHLETVLRRGIAAQATGRHAEAESLFRTVLRDAPGLPDGLHLLAQSRHLQGDNDEALELVGRAMRAAPRVAMYQATRGVVLRALGRPTEAAAAFEAALRLDPTYLGAHRNLAALHASTGGFEAARAAFTRALALAPSDVELWLGLVPVLLSLGKPGEAAAAAERAAGLAPRATTPIEVWFAAADAAGALPTLRFKLERLLAEDPENTAVHLALVDVLNRLDAMDAARDLAERAIARWPDNAAAWRRAGLQRAAVGDDDAAQLAFERALELDPSDTAARVGIANGHHRRGDAVRALEIYRAILANHPRCKEAWYNAGTVLSALGREDEAIEHYDRAITIDTDYAPARNNRAQGLLRLGRQAEAWSDHRWRDGRTPLFPEQRWPADLDGVAIHVRAEQGIGDHLFYLRFAPAIAARGAIVTVEAERRIEPMVRRAGLDAVDDAPVGANVVRMGDLPWLLGLGDGDDFATPLALPVLVDRAARVAAELAALPRPWIGVTWHAGGAKGRRETFKTIPVDRLGRTLRDLPGTVVSVQRNPVATDQAALEGTLGRPLLDLSRWNDDLELMLALMAALDGYVGVSNANIHLRCGAGLGSDVLVPFPMDWRWRSLSNGAVPWYPGSRAYRQRADGDWDAGFAALEKSLQERWT